MDVSIVGVIQSLAQPLASAHISVYILSMYDTDYVMIKEEDVEAARGVLSGAGHRIL